MKKPTPFSRKAATILFLLFAPSIIFAQYGSFSSFEALHSAAEQGDADAQFMLGKYYCDKAHQLINRDIYVKDSVEHAYANAFKWYRKAARHKNAEAQNELGLFYSIGISKAKQNYTKAVKWYRKAAEQGIAMAQYELGICYMRGDGVKPNITEQIKWIRLAAEQGYVYAQINLGAIYYRGNGVEKNRIEAIKWYRKAAEQGSEYAQSLLESLQD